MNKEYKQWKKFLAKPYMLIILGLFYNDYLFGVNLIFNFILSLEGIIGRIKNMQRQESNFLSLFFIMVFHTEKLSGFGFIFVMEE